MTKMTPFLWFEKDIKGIIDFYRSVFPDIKVSSNGELEDTPFTEAFVKMKKFDIKALEEAFNNN